MTTPTKRRRRDRNKRGSDAADCGLEHGREEKRTRKNYYLYQSKIDMVKEILGAKSETEALDGALDLLIYGEALARGTEEMQGEEYRDVLGIADEGKDAGAES